MNVFLKHALEKWLKGRPQIVKDLARKYPPGTCFIIHGKPAWVISYEESGSLCVTDIYPATDYKKAVETRRPICACCVGKLESLLHEG